MKIRAMIPAILALVILVGGPFGFGRMCDTDARGGLACYCCSDLGKNCTMISCEGCCGAHAGSVADRWSPEMIPTFLPPLFFLKAATNRGEALQPPESVCLEIPDKPPKRA